MILGVVDIHMHYNFKISAGVLFGAQGWLLYLGTSMFRGFDAKVS